MNLNERCPCCGVAFLGPRRELKCADCGAWVCTDCAKESHLDERGLAVHFCKACCDPGDRKG